MRGASRFGQRRTGKLAASLAVLVSLGSGALVSLGGATPASAATREATAPYSYGWASAGTGSPLWSVNLQAEIKWNGSDVYVAAGPYCTASGIGISVTWCGATGGGSSNLTLGLNYEECIGIGPISECFSGGLRQVFNQSGHQVNFYTF